MGGVAPHHRVASVCSIHALTCSTPTRGLASLSRTLGSHAIPLCRMPLRHAPRAAYRMPRLLPSLCCHSSHAWPPHRLATACRTRPLLASRSGARRLLVACRTLVSHAARSSRPSCRISHLLPLVASPRYHRLATARRMRPLLASHSGAHRTAHPAQSHHGHISVRYATVSTVRHRGLCPKACAVHRMVSTVRPRAAARTHAHDQHQSHTGRSHTRYVWSGRACTAKDLWDVCMPNGRLRTKA